jgi:hypothetical protein
MKALDLMSEPYFVIVEEQEFNDYAVAIDRARLLVLDPAYQRDYDACMTLESHQSRGSGPARNFAWDHAAANGHEWHWVIDDNIRWFNRLHNNRKRRCISPGFFRAMEDFVDRYDNIAMAGPNYRFFANQRSTLPPFYLNTRIYSCNLIRTELSFRWRGRYNEDTILSLDMLKANWCTVLFNAFLIDKMTTQSMKGGNTDEIYADGTREKSAMLVREHPDVARIAERYGRIHHDVDYTRFAQTRLRLKNDAQILTEQNEYGMQLASLDHKSGANRS